MTEQSARFSGRLVAERRHRSWFGVVMLLASMVAVTVPTKASAVVASVAVSSSHVSQAGEVVTVTGSGFDPAANVGTRPPLAGQPSGFYVVFGRIGDPWAPSTGAASSTREVLSQVWVLPAASRAILDPGGTNPSFATLNPDGSFALAIEVAPGGTSAGDYAIVTYAASGAVNAEHETRTPISFYDPTTTTTATTSTSSSTSSTSTTVPTSSSTSSTSTTVPTSSSSATSTSTVAASSSVTSSSVTSTSVTPASSASSVVNRRVSETGPGGQTLTADPALDLDPAGQSVTVTGTGYDPSVGIYVSLCVDNGPGVAPSPCVGGASAQSESTAWVSSNPPSYGAGLAHAFGPGGTFEVRLQVVADDGSVNCLKVACVIVTRADHTDSANRSADVRIPVTWLDATKVGSSSTSESASATGNSQVVRQLPSGTGSASTGEVDAARQTSRVGSDRTLAFSGSGTDGLLSFGILLVGIGTILLSRSLRQRAVR